MRLPPVSLVALVAILTFGLFGTGCSHFARRNSAATVGNRVAIALTINGTEQPTPQQWATMIKAIEPELAVYGLVLVDDLALADRILRIDITPSLTDPNSGRAVVLGWRANPLRGITYARAGSTPAFRTSYTSGLSTYYNSTFGYERYSDHGYSSGYAGGSSGGSTAAPTNPPGKPTHPETHRGDRPPGTTPPADRGRGRYAGGELPRHPDRGHRHEPPTSSPTSTSPSGGSSSHSSGSSSSPSYSSSSSSSSGSYSSGSSGSYSSSSATTSSSSPSSSPSSGAQLSRATKEK